MPEVTDTCHSYKPVMCMHEYVCPYVRVYVCMTVCHNVVMHSQMKEVSLKAFIMFHMFSMDTMLPSPHLL